MLETEVKVPAALNIPFGKLFFGFNVVPYVPPEPKPSESAGPSSPPPVRAMYWYVSLTHMIVIPRHHSLALGTLLMVEPLKRPQQRVRRRKPLFRRRKLVSNRGELGRLWVLGPRRQHTSLRASEVLRSTLLHPHRLNLSPKDGVQPPIGV